jgi:hypothetical protein
MDTQTFDLLCAWVLRVKYYGWGEGVGKKSVQPQHYASALRCRDKKAELAIL